MSKSDSDQIPTKSSFEAQPEYDPALPPLSGHILSLFYSHQPRRTLRDIARRTHASRSTLKKYISELIRSGHLRKRGKGRATWYTL